MIHKVFSWKVGAILLLAVAIFADPINAACAAAGASFIHIPPLHALLAMGGGALPMFIGAISPDVRGTLVEGPLQTSSVAYRNKNYIGSGIFSIVPGASPKAKILVYPKGTFFTDEASIRAPGTRSKRGTIKYDSVSLSFDQYAFAKEVTDEDRENSRIAGAPPILVEQDAVEYCADKIDLRKERIIRDLIFNTTWSDNNSGGEDAEGRWAAGTGNTFLADIRNGIKTIHDNTGIKPNKLAMDLGTMLSLKEESTVLDKIKYTQRGILTPELLAALLELDEVLIGDAIYSTAKETKAGTEFTPANIWEKNAGKGMGFLFYTPPRPGLKTPISGVQAQATFPLNGLPRQVTTWRENAEHQDVFEVAEHTCIRVVGAGLGYLWCDTLAT